MITKKWQTTFLVGLTLPLLLGGCFDSKIVLVNQSSSKIRDIQVKVNNKTFTAKDIPVRKLQNWRFQPQQDDSFQVTGRLDTGTPIQGNNLGYTTNSDTSVHYLLVQKDGSVLYSQDTQNLNSYLQP